MRIYTINWKPYSFMDTLFAATDSNTADSKSTAIVQDSSTAMKPWNTASKVQFRSDFLHKLQQHAKCFFLGVRVGKEE